ncbi:DUF4321 domain-containing protein [Clostridium polynesiense]|uniref:DUF4321 domain-containing protein n=1 Tax=Clostridium polynesiense TaxID=1325933 RepID=UPI00058EEE1C|nr:DUF4321 domain-containing protein [Clostridium polynesiense]
MSTSNKSFSLIIFIILGAISGSILGEFLGSYFPSLKILSTIYSIGTKAPLFVDLKVMTLTLGMTVNLNVMTIIGVILSIILYKKY